MRTCRSPYAAIVFCVVPLSAQITPTEPVQLFNSQNLNNLYTYLEESKREDPRQVFTVRNGHLRISGEEWGGITTTDTYSDYHLIVEWKWGGATFVPRRDRARDSGILVHGTGPDGAAGGRWLESIEYQVIEGGTGDFILVAGQNRPQMTVESRRGPHGQWYWEGGGKPVRLDRGRFNWFARDPEWKDTVGFRGADDIENPVGEWNTSEVICSGDTITAILNGTIVNRGTESTHTQGKIQIQSEGAEIVIRRIELRPIQ